MAKTVRSEENQGTRHEVLVENRVGRVSLRSPGPFPALHRRLRLPRDATVSELAREVRGGVHGVHIHESLAGENRREKAGTFYSVFRARDAVAAET